ncbi:glycosyltransferase family 2 protein [Spirosoma pomorum]
MLSSKVYIIVLNYNGWKDTVECIESLLLLNYIDFQIVVVDNCSNDDSLINIETWLIKNNFIVDTSKLSQTNQDLRSKSTTVFVSPSSRDKPPYITLIQTKKNFGYAGGNNVGITYALDAGDTSFVWILNNDTVVDPESLRFLVAEMRSRAQQNIGLVGGRVMYYHDPKRIQCFGGAYYNKWLGYSQQIGNGEIESGQFTNIDIKPDLIIGACTLVSVHFLRKVGLLNEEYFLYFEEQDWAERAKQAGFRIGIAKNAVVYHKEGATIGAGQLTGSSRFSDYYFARSKILFTDKYYTILVSLSVRVSLILTIFNRIKRNQYNRIIMLLKIMFSSRRRLLNSTFKK